jgi:hypothetical protein
VSQNEDGKIDICQVQGAVHSSPAAKEKGLSFVVRIKRVLKRRLSIRAQKKIKDSISSALDLLDRSLGTAKKSEIPLNTQQSQRLKAGDLVRVRSREEIQATLDRWRALKGCGFLGEMAGYCGTNQRVLKRVERFIDERDYRLKKASGIVLLDGVICSGNGKCDRCCFFFWREEWLEKLDRN